MQTEGSKLREEINFFVSHAHRNKVLVRDFLARLDDVLAPSKRYKYSRWQDSDLIVGENWQVQITDAIKSCDLGLLMISPAFLASS